MTSTNKVFINTTEPLLFSPEVLINRVCEDRNIHNSHIEFSFINDAAMCALHAQYLGDDTVTDSMTFNLGNTAITPYDTGYDNLIIDSYVCLDQAARQASDYANSLTIELKTLVIHGLLHGIGYTDTDPASRDTMVNAQNRLLTLV